MGRRRIMEPQPRQVIAEQIGKYGCYFLSVIRAAEKIVGRRIDAIAVYEDIVKRGWMGPDCYMHRPNEILAYLVGGTWHVQHQSRLYKPKEGEIVILRYERKDPAGAWAHFVLAAPDGQTVEYDPYGDSKTVRDGELISKRVFTRIGE
jgi:hypothetical protein